MTSLEEVLRGLGPVDPPPSLDALGGEVSVLAEVPEVDAELLPRLIETVGTDWGSVKDPESLTAAVAVRLPEVAGPLSFANAADFLLAMTVSTGDAELARTLMQQLLEVASDVEGSERALRAGHAVRAAVDLALLDVGVTTHGVLAAIENTTEVPPEMASGLARAAGRLWEHHDEAFLQEVLEHRVLRHDDAAADAMVELGLKAVRDAFDATDKDVSMEALARSIELFDRAAQYDEDRPDARAYKAAAQAVLAFEADVEAMTAALEDLRLARGELDRYSVSAEDDFRGAAPLRSVSEWHVLAATLRNVRSHLDEPDVLNLRPAIEALADAYRGMRLGVLQDERFGLRAFIQPVITSAIAERPALADGLEQLAGEPGAPASAAALVEELARPKARPKRRANRQTNTSRRP